MNLNFIKQALTEFLCCPQCKSNLELVSNDGMRCFFCFREYQIKNEILILLSTVQGEPVDELRLRDEVAAKHGSTQEEEILKVVSQHHCLSVMSKRAKDFRAKFNPSQWILDVGCGTGWYWRNTGGALILIDFALGNLMAAKTLLEGQNNVLLVQANASHLPIKPNLLSGMWSVQVTQHFPDVVFEQFLSELKRVLKNKFLIEIYNLNPARLHRVIYRVFGKKLHIKDKLGDMVLNQLNAYELVNLWKDIAKNAKVEIGYSELFFHPNFHLRPKNKFIALIESLITKVTWMTSTIARQIHIKIYNGL